MNQEQLKQIEQGRGFITALDQSGGSTPQALANYGINEDAYSSEDEMFELVHTMRSRIITSPSFTSEHVIGVILFKQTMRSQVDGLDTADYLWQRKKIVPFLKIDDGLAELADGVQIMKPMSELDNLLTEAKQKHIFGTKMRSVIKEGNKVGMKNVVDQQFDLAKKITKVGLVPIIEPEVDIHSPNKGDIEQELKQLLLDGLDSLSDDQRIIFKLTLPEQDNLYFELVNHPKVIRVFALSGGYSRDEANAKLSRNQGIIASFNRALSEGLYANQTDEEFDQILAKSIESIYQASIT